MRSIYAKILAWTLGTFAVALLGFGAISITLAGHGPGPIEFISRTTGLLGDDAARAHEQGGPDQLGAYLRRLDAYYPEARHHLTDARGLDLVDGEDRSAWLADARPERGPPRRVGGSLLLARGVRGGRYHLLVVIRPRFDPRGILPYFAAVVLVIALLGYALAVHLAAPLRRLRLVVDRFGRGDLAARSCSSRKDEIGELSRSFDEMADQIETLRAAELRLMQDVSHELRSPLARLGFNLELARLGDDREAAFGRIGRDLARLSGLVDQLLLLTTAEGDPAARRDQVVRLDDLLRATVEDCEVEAAGKGCRLALHLDGPVTLIGDQELLRRAVENVLRNAIRHAPGGTAVEVDLATRPGAASVVVRDHGEGVPDAWLGAIFDPFFRVAEDRSRSSGGAGLGLSIARRAVELHGGRAWAEDAAPGLRVTLDLPLDQPRPT